MEIGTPMTLTQMNAAEAVIGSATRAFPPAGVAIFYGATVDNATGDPSISGAWTGTYSGLINECEARAEATFAENRVSVSEQINVSRPCGNSFAFQGTFQGNTLDGEFTEFRRLPHSRTGNRFGRNPGDLPRRRGVRQQSDEFPSIDRHARSVHAVAGDDVRPEGRSR